MATRQGKSDGSEGGSSKTLKEFLTITGSVLGIVAAVIGIVNALYPASDAKPYFVLDSGQRAYLPQSLVVAAENEAANKAEPIIVRVDNVGSTQSYPPGPKNANGMQTWIVSLPRTTYTELYQIKEERTCELLVGFKSEEYSEQPIPAIIKPQPPKVAIGGTQLPPNIGVAKKDGSDSSLRSQAITRPYRKSEPAWLQWFRFFTNNWWYTFLAVFFLSGLLTSVWKGVQNLFQ